MDNAAARRHSEILRAKIAAAADAKAAADQTLRDAECAARAAAEAYFIAPAVACRLTPRNLGRENVLVLMQEMVCLWRQGSGDHCRIIGFSRRLVIASADAAIARIRPKGGASEPTAIDRSVAAVFARRLLSAIAPRADDRHRTALAATAPAEIFAASAPAHWSILTVAIDFGDEEPSTAIIAAPAAAQPLNGAAGVDALKPRLGKIRLSARCIAGNFDAPVASIIALKPGDRLSVGWRGEGEASLTFGGHPFATCVIGDKDGARAVKVNG